MAGEMDLDGKALVIAFFAQRQLAGQGGAEGAIGIVDLVVHVDRPRIVGIERRLDILQQALV